jgi:hypothetical protein
MWKKIGMSAVVAAFLAGGPSLGYAQAVPGSGDQTQGAGSRPGSTGADTSSTGSRLENGGSSAGGGIGTTGGTSDMGTSKDTLGKESSPPGTSSGLNRSMGNQTTGSGSTTGVGAGRGERHPLKLSGRIGLCESHDIKATAATRSVKRDRGQSPILRGISLRCD